MVENAVPAARLLTDRLTAAVAEHRSMLVHATQAKAVLEIGLFTGYSALAMAEALPAGCELVACEILGFFNSL